MRIATLRVVVVTKRPPALGLCLGDAVLRPVGYFASDHESTEKATPLRPERRLEYAWCLDREMIVANVGHCSPLWAGPVQIEAVINETVGQIQRQSKTRRFAYYLIPAHEHPDQNPLFSSPGKISCRH